MEITLKATGYVAFLSVCVAPFLFGAVERSIWIPLCQFWLVLGMLATALRASNAADDQGPVAAALSRALRPLHGLFFLQLVPMPGSILHALSTASWAAHFVPAPNDGRWRPLTVSPGATVEAWLYVAALQGLFIALLGIPVARRERCVLGLMGVAALLGAEGLWQSRTAHPHWLYGQIEFFTYPGLETGSFGPYFNRNHFATVTAMGAVLAGGYAMLVISAENGLGRLLRVPGLMAKFVVLGGLSGFLALATAATGSRSGAAALLVSLAFVLTRRLSRTQGILALGVAATGIILSGAFVTERLINGSILASRIPGWLDISRLLAYFPVFGAGFGTFIVAYYPYQINAPYEIWQHAHNEYLECLIEGGVVGLAVIGWFARRAVREIGFSPALRLPALAAAIVFGVQCVADFPARIPANAAFLIGVLALSSVRRRP